MIAADPAASRDPAGFVYRRDGVLLRQVNRCHAAAYDRIVASGILTELQEAELLVRHEDAAPDLAATGDAHRVLRPDVVDFISYPYEWSFSQLRDAALLTLEVQARALERGATLRDASAFNVQFRGANPVLIDTLSIGPYEEGRPWAAYRQFCEHFLAPLALMARRDVRLGLLHAQFADGIPLDLASGLLDARSWARPSLLLHVHLHARAQDRWADAATRTRPARSVRLERAALQRLVGQLQETIAALSWEPVGTTWAEYEGTHGYSGDAAGSKEALVRQLLAQVQPEITWDLGANTGRFSRIAAEAGSRVIAMDADPAAVDRAYRAERARGEGRITPIVSDLLMPSPASGWAGSERMSLAQRGPADAILALAVVHHLAVTGNMSLPRVADWFARLGRWALVEHVPPDDPQMLRLLSARPEATHPHDAAAFDAAFAARFETVRREPIVGSGRVLHLLRRREDLPS